MTRSPGSGDATQRAPAEALDIEAALQLAAIREHSLRSLSEFSQNLSSAPDLHHLVDLALFNLLGHFGTSRAALWMRSENEDGAPVLVRAHGMRQEAITNASIACADRLMRADTDSDAMFTVDELDEWVGVEGRQAAERAGIALFARVSAQHEPIGLLALGSRIGGTQYGSEERTALHVSLSVFGVAVQNHSLLARMGENNRQLRRAFDELQDVDRLKSEIISNVKHELCTPLSVIIGYAEVGMDNDINELRRKRIMDVVLEQAKKLNSMIENIVTLSQVTAGILHLELVNGDAGTCVRNYCETRRPGISGRLRELAWTIAPDLPTVCFDPRRLEQVVEALLDNAVKFSPEGSRIDVRVSRRESETGTRLVVEVADQGPGVALERLDVLSKPFRQADGSSTRAVGGLGIGLHFCRQIIHAMGGELEVESEPGQGSTFQLSLPEI